MKKVLFLILVASTMMRAQPAFMLFNDGISEINEIELAPNTLWLATESGVVEVNVSSKSFTTHLSGSFSAVLVHQNVVYAASKTNGLYQKSGATWVNFTTADGLSSNIVNDIAADTLGNIWLATGNGVCKYDGATFTTFQPLQNPNISAVACFGNNVFVGNDDISEGVKKYDGASWVALPAMPNFANRVRQLECDAAGRPVVAGVAGIHILYNGVWNAAFTHHNPYINASNGHLWFVANEDVGALVDTNTAILENPFELQSNAIVAIAAEYSDSTFWVALQDGGNTTLARFFVDAQYVPTVFSPNNLSAPYRPDGVFTNNFNAALPSGLSTQNKTLVYANGDLLSGWQGNATTRSTAVRTYGSDISPTWVAGPASIQRNNQAFFEKYYRTWQVSKAEIENHKTQYNQPGYQMPEAILNWPGNGDLSAGESRFIAPFIDLNANGLYEPHLGEYPEIRGDEALFMVYNTVDAYAPYGQTNLDLESHTLVYGFDSLNSPLQNTLFVHQQIVSKTRMLDTLLQGFFTDFDLGNPFDDVIAADSSRNMIYVLNGDFDDDGPVGFGLNPPAAGLIMLGQPLAGAMGAGIANPNPDDELETHMLLRRRFVDGEPIRQDTTGGIGYLPGSNNSITNFQFNGKNSWLGGFSTNLLQDKRFTAVIAHTNVQPLQPICIDYAYSFAHAASSNPGLFDAADSLINNATYIANFFQQQQFGCLGADLATPDNDIQTAEVLLYPNPANQNVVVANLPETENLQVELIDIMGRTMQKVETGGSAEYTLSTAALPQGLYILKVYTPTTIWSTQKLIIKH